MTEEFDTQVRLTLFRGFLESGEAPTAAGLAVKMGVPEGEVRAALERLAEGKAIVLQPESRELLMANPLCAVPTPYRVRTAEKSYFSACVWDGLGAMAMIGRDAAVESSCPCCGEGMRIEVREGRLQPAEGVIHFAVPAHCWWDNIVFT